MWRIRAGSPCLPLLCLWAWALLPANGAAPAVPIMAPANQRKSEGRLLEGLKNGAASGLAAACVKTVLQPFDSMKTMQQFSKEPMSLLGAGRALLARGGIPALYSGLGVTLAGSMPSVGIYFGIYQYCRSHLEAVPWIPHSAAIVASAGLGNFVASFFRVPYEVVKQQLQAGVYANSGTALRALWANGGPMGFFPTGALTTQWARDIPYAMVTLLCYESMHAVLAKRRNREKGVPASPVENMIIGAVAGGIGSFATNPMDVIKTRMMVSPNKYPTAWTAATIALTEEGPSVFMRGCTPRLLHKVPANGVFFLAYEMFRGLLGVGAST
jgi:solute carrier family 25 S-adenosylmethionine transporter 26